MRLVAKVQGIKNSAKHHSDRKSLARYIALSVHPRFKHGIPKSLRSSAASVVPKPPLLSELACILLEGCRKTLGGAHVCHTFEARGYGVFHEIYLTGIGETRDAYSP
eukprot:Opistho-2@74466